MKKLIALLLTLALICASVSAMALTFDHAAFVNAYNSTCKSTFERMVGKGSTADAYTTKSQLTLVNTTNSYAIYANSADTFELVFKLDGTDMRAWVKIGSETGNFPLFALAPLLLELDSSADSNVIDTILNFKQPVFPVSTGHYTINCVIIPWNCDALQFTIN